MFDIGFTELMIIGVVGLVVIGPERLPRVARTVGHLLGRLQRYVGDVKSDIQREMQIEDLKKLQQEVADSARDMENNIRAQSDELKQGMTSTADSLNSAVAGLAADASRRDEPAAPAVDAAALADAERTIAQAVADGHERPDTGPVASEAAEGQMALGLDGEAARKDDSKA